MLDKHVVSEFAHVKPGDTAWRSDGLREFFLYKDLGVAEATGGRVIAQLVKANEAPEQDCVHQRPGIRHFLSDYSPDMEYLEVVGPADFGTVDADGPAPIPPPMPWG